MKTIIEHIDDEIYEWSMIEYRHISEIVGKKNLVFTNINNNENNAVQKLSQIGSVETKSINDIMERKKFGRICLLDPKGDKMLTSQDGANFDCFLFGGILGDSPMKGRTEKHFRKMVFERRNLGEKQMSTDTAVLVAHKIIDEKKRFEDLDFVDEIEIVLEDEDTKHGKMTHSQILPYRYLVENGKPILPDGLIEYLQNEE